MRFAVLTLIFGLAVGVSAGFFARDLTNGNRACEEWTRSLDQLSRGGIYISSGPDKGKLEPQGRLDYFKEAFAVRNAACQD